MDINKKVGENIVAENANWTFGGNTPKNFSSHVKKSVPFYEEGHEIILKLSDFFVKDSSVCYELGVSTGVLIKKLAEKHSRIKVDWIGIDKESTMINQAKLEIKPSKLEKNIKLIVDDINLHNYEPSNLIVSYYTLQFVHPNIRQELINKVYESLKWGGAFIVFEKVRASDARFQDIMSILYTDFKLDQGYSCDEIVAKTKSLKGILEPFSTLGNYELFQRAGFKDIITIFKYLCFEGFLCIK